MLLWHIYWVFFRIGAFSFGGGYAMIPLFQKDLVEIYHWVSLEQMLDMIAISQMTPGPIAVNIATFAGYQIAGFWGSFFATFGVISPSILIILIVVMFFLRFQNTPAVQSVMSGIRPAAVALIVVATISVAQGALLNWTYWLLLLVSFIAAYRFKLHPIPLILLAGVIGLLFF